MRAHGWQHGGGLFISISGTAALTNTNVHDNQGSVRSPFDLSLNFHPSSAPLERYVCAHCLQNGGGLWIEGTATLTNTNVYENQALYVRSPFERPKYVLPRWNKRALTFPCRVVASTSQAKRR